MQDATPMLPGDTIPAEYQDVVDRIARVAAGLARRIARDGIDERLAEARGTNADGDGQKALDVIADEMFCTALRGAGVRWLASEEQEQALALDPQGSLAVAIDPLDGSSNIDTNVSIGTIFSIYPAEDTAEASFLRPTRQQIGAGYVIYGPRCAMMVSFGDGVQQYLLDPDTGAFRLVDGRLTMPDCSFEFAINASNYRHWSRPIRAYIDDCVAGIEGPRETNFNMRWIASLVAETHRILTRGGIFLYPSDARKGYERGRLRMLYECAPIAFLIEQAGGRATDACEPILDQAATALHQRTPLVFGSAEKVARVAAYHDLPETEVSALFGHRGLFRA